MRCSSQMCYKRTLQVDRNLNTEKHRSHNKIPRVQKLATGVGEKNVTRQVQGQLILQQYMICSRTGNRFAKQNL